MIGKIGAALGIIVVLIGGLYAFWETRATAQSASGQSKENKAELRGQAEQIQILTDIHTKQQAAKEAEEALIKKLCRQGKLAREECPDD